MRRVLKWVAIVFGGLIGLLVVTAVILFLIGGSRIGRLHEVSVPSIIVPTDSQAVARGRHLAEAVMLCMGCHGDDLSGDVLFDEPIFATIYGSNLTSGRGGKGATFSDADFVRAIRHGVNPEGRALMVMHSDAYHHLTAGDLGALIAFVRSVPPVEREVPVSRGGPLGKIVVALGLMETETMPFLPAEGIDHDAPIAHGPAPALTAEYGEYLVRIGICSLCHGADLTGAPPIEPGGLAGPNIVIYGTDALSDEQFISTIRTGVNPSGRSLDPSAMPWEVYGKMTDDELRAIRLHLAALAQS